MIKTRFRVVSSKKNDLLIGLVGLLILLLILIFKPIENAQYDAIPVFVYLVVFFVLWSQKWFSSEEFFENVWVLLGFILMIIAAIFVLVTLNTDAELVHVYQSLFDALKEGSNPYKDPVIYHITGDGSISYQQFNYPPGEIVIYWLGYLILQKWNYGIIIAINLTINAIVAYFFVKNSPQLENNRKVVFVLFLLLMNVHNSASTTLFTAMAIGFILRAKMEEKHRRILLVLLMGFGSLTKFFILVLIAVYFWYKIIEQREWSYFIDAGGVLLIILVSCVPFGLLNVWNSTIAFNLELSGREEVTTYYPNLISAIFYIVKLKVIYPLVVIILFALALIATRRKDLLDRMVIIGAISMLLFPTPEDQFIGALVGLLLIAKIDKLEPKPKSQ
ncbi:MAG: hypothetical protein ACTSYA_07325 [Candidatus Kariarchaeaceae archaeon]